MRTERAKRRATSCYIEAPFVSILADYSNVAKPGVEFPWKFKGYYYRYESRREKRIIDAIWNEMTNVDSVILSPRAHRVILTGNHIVLNSVGIFKGKRHMRICVIYILLANPRYAVEYI